uniref:ribonuclease H n=1 Tax=Naja naja TaxID=35670 RepID=A0A8C7E306_NAJNA
MVFLKLTLYHEKPIWVDQWPLTREKLNSLNILVKKQLELGHIEPSTSPYNSPVFVIKKKSGAGRFLTNLRKVNEVIMPMGPLQCGLPNPNLIPENYDLLIIDLKDCFFSIPLHPQDRKLFAFTVPVVNNQAPTSRFQWKVLPQGMLNSPTICQKFVDNALQPFRNLHPGWLVYHYMDDILVAAPGPKGMVRQQLEELSTILTKAGLKIAPDKVQFTAPWKYLGFKMTQAMIIPVMARANLGSSPTLLQLQTWLGNINWTRPYTKLTTEELKPLFEGLKGGVEPTDIILLTKQQQEVVKLVEERFQYHWTNKCAENVPVVLEILTGRLPTAVLAQETAPVRILEWIHLRHTPGKSVLSQGEAYKAIIMKGRNRCLCLTGLDPGKIIVPMSLQDWEWLLGSNEHLQLAMENYVGKVVYHGLKDPRLQMIVNSVLQIVPCQQLTPIPEALTVFADGEGHMALVFGGTDGWKTKITGPQQSAQRAELAATIEAFKT